MILKCPRLDRIKWADDQIGGPAAYQSGESVSVDKDSANLYYGVSHVRPVVTCHPMHALKCFPQYTGVPVDYDRPFSQVSAPFGSWEPERYYGKPGTIVTQPRAVIINFQQDGGFPAMPFNPNLVDAIELIAEEYTDRGIHIYMLDFPWGDTQFLTRGIPHGGLIPDYYGGGLIDNSHGYLSPFGYSSGDLLFINIHPNPIGWTDTGAHTTSNYNFGINTVGCDRIGCGTGMALGDTVPAGYYGFLNVFDSGSLTWIQTASASAASLANDQDYYQQFYEARDGHDRFRHILHVADSPTITKTYGDSVFGPPPMNYAAGYPGSTQACFSAATAGLDGFVLGDDIDSFGSTEDLAEMLQADIDDFYPE